MQTLVKRCTLGASVFFAFVTPLVQASSPQALGFGHAGIDQDWELVCDNTRTCRAAGYSSSAEDANALQVSVLLTRKAGANTALTAQVQFGTVVRAEEVLRAAALRPVLTINDRVHGANTFPQQRLVADLSEAQVSALLDGLRRGSKIQWQAGAYAWRLSTQGALQALQKMDELQGRVSTPGALVHQGNRPEAAVLAPLPLPVVIAAPVPNIALSDEAIPLSLKQSLRQAVYEYAKNTKPRYAAREHCPLFLESNSTPITLYPLSQNKRLAASDCWSGAYNRGVGFWLINAKPPYQARLITPNGSDYSLGQITAFHRGHAQGYCHSEQHWVWDGKQFPQTLFQTNGMCRPVTAGGAWVLPKLLSEIKN